MLAAFIPLWPYANGCEANLASGLALCLSWSRALGSPGSLPSSRRSPSPSCSCTPRFLPPLSLSSLVLSPPGPLDPASSISRLSSRLSISPTTSHRTRGDAENVHCTGTQGEGSCRAGILLSGAGVKTVRSHSLARPLPLPPAKACSAGCWSRALTVTAKLACKYAGRVLLVPYRTFGHSVVGLSFVHDLFRSFALAFQAFLRSFVRFVVAAACGFLSSFLLLLRAIFSSQIGLVLSPIVTPHAPSIIGAGRSF